jgi:hypothetical protein
MMMICTNTYKSTVDMDAIELAWVGRQLELLTGRMCTHMSVACAVRHWRSEACGRVVQTLGYFYCSAYLGSEALEGIECWTKQPRDPAGIIATPDPMRHCSGVGMHHDR